MAKLGVMLNKPAQRYVALYAGKASIFTASTEGGLSVQIPGTLLNHFVALDSVCGSFDFHFDRSNRLASVECVP